jgi:NAD dependent epimerase/dehydratase family enzyme
LGKVLGRPAKMAVPALMLKMMMGELGDVLLSSQRALPVNLLAAGFEFGFPQIDMALANLINR